MRSMSGAIQLYDTTRYCLETHYEMIAKLATSDHSLKDIHPCYSLEIGKPIHLLHLPWKILMARHNSRLSAQCSIITTAIMIMGI